MLIFIPASFWVAHTCFGAGKLSYKALALIGVIGVIVHVVLMGSVMLFTHGFISADALVFIQMMNAALILITPWVGEKNLEMRHRT